MNRRIIVLDWNRKTWKLVGRAINGLPGYKVEGCVLLEDAKATLVDPLRLDLRLFVISDVAEAEKAETRKWVQELYMAGHTAIWLSEVLPPLVEIKHVFKTMPFDEALEEKLRAVIAKALKTKK